MKFLNIIAASLLVLGMASCGKTASGPSPLEAQAERLDDELGKLAEESPMYLSEIDASYENATLTVDIEFSDTVVNVADYSDALVQYVLAQYLKNHTGANLDEIANTLTKEKGQLVIKLEDTHGNTRDYNVSAARFVKLIKLRPMELNYNDVRTNVSDILASRCASYAAAYNATSCEFDIAYSFAQYTLTFPNTRAFANLNQASLTGRYQKILKEQYENYGACRPMVEDLLKSLSIDGYRFIYLAPDGKSGLTAGLPWRTIN
ncbi:MAG: hypothetical protein HDS65_10575 [Bacteroidales bacterium]|nr:hypothetical protein [Bacteroidales bacterium]